MSYFFIVLHNHVLFLYLHVLFPCLIAQPCLLSLSYCATMSYFFILLRNYIMLLYLIAQPSLLLSGIAQPCLIALSYCASMSYFFTLLRNHVLFLYLFAQPWVTFYLTEQPCLISLPYCATMSHFFILLGNHVLFLYLIAHPAYLETSVSRKSLTSTRLHRQHLQATSKAPPTESPVTITSSGRRVGKPVRFS